jgi:quercetin dioxygenase-like cupin family protein
MERVFSIDDMPWTDLKGLPGARGFEFKALTNDAYTKAYSCELVRLEPGDHSVPHIEPWSHLLYILRGTGDVTIDGSTAPIRSGTVCQVRAGEKHSLRNLGEDDMLILAIYDPPRERKKVKNTQPGREDRAGRRV